MATVGDGGELPVRPWFAWPLASQAAFVAALVVGSAAAAVAVERRGRDGMGHAGVGRQPASRVIEAARDVAATSEAMRIFMGVAVAAARYVSGGLVLVMVAACATFGALLGRMADFRIDFRIQGAD
jgi:hypothetical protein